MASITATSSLTPATLLYKPSLPLSSPVLGLPTIGSKGRVRCSMERKEESSKKQGMNASLIAAVCGATMSSPAMALVDERMSTEGTGLPFGLSNNLLVWILLGVFGFIWAFYIVYTSTLEEDEESGLSL